MYQEISQLLMYGDLDEDSILAQMGEVFGNMRPVNIIKPDLSAISIRR